MFGSLSGSVEYIRTANGIEVPVPDHVLPQAVELRDQVAAAPLGPPGSPCGPRTNCEFARRQAKPSTRWGSGGPQDNNEEVHPKTDMTTYHEKISASQFH